jgi:hypothetical protein
VLFGARGRLVEQGSNLPKRPDVIGHARSHRGGSGVGSPEALVRANEVVEHEMEGHDRGMVLNLPAESVCEPCVSPQIHQSHSVGLPPWMIISVAFGTP